MITAIVQFKLSAPVTREKAAELFATTAPRYRDLPGLIRKYYLLSEDGGTAGGVYLWQSRQQPDRLYTDEWRQFIRDRYGSGPMITFFESPVIVDNSEGKIITD